MHKISRWGIGWVAVLGSLCGPARAQFSGSVVVQGGVERPAMGNSPFAGAVYYVDNVAGSDTNDGTARTRPWKTLAKVNAFQALLYPGDTVLLKRGDVFPEMIKVSNLKTATSSAVTYTTNPMPMAGVTIGAYGAVGAALKDSQGNVVPGLYANDPIIDSADAITPTWTPVTGNTYSTPLASCPAKLFGSEAESQRYYPVYNYAGTFDTTGNTNYNCFDEVLSSVTSKYYANESGLPTNGSPITYYNLWTTVYTSTTLNGGLTQDTSPTTAQLTQTGLQNVEACTINCFWYDSINKLLYVTMASGAPPATMYATNPNRPYAILIQGSTGVSVNHVQMAHGLKGGYKCLPYALTSYGYIACQNSNIHHIAVYNTGDQTATDRLAQQGGYDGSSAAVSFPNNYNETYPSLEVGNTVQNSYFGQSDGYNVRGVLMFLQDGTQTVAGVTTNRSVIGYNKFVNTSLAVVYGNNGAGLTMASAPTTTNPSNYNTTSKIYALLSKGGMVNNNYAYGYHLTAFGVSGIQGGEIVNNIAAHGHGEGFQGGGGSSSTTTGDWTTQYIHFNACLHLAASDTGSGINCIDTNDGGTAALAARTDWGPYTYNEYIEHNTCIDVSGNCITAEPGEIQAVIRWNAIYQIGDGVTGNNSLGACGNAGAYYGIKNGVSLGTGPIYAYQAIACLGYYGYAIAQFDNTSAERETCSNMATFIPTYNSSAVGDTSTGCDMTSANPPWFNNMVGGVATDDFTIPPNSYLATFSGTSSAAGALQPGQAIWATGPQVDPNLYQ